MIGKHLDLPLKSSNWESLDNCPGWLCTNLHLFAECHPCASFGGWLCPGLDAAKAWKGKDTRLLHFLGGDGCKAVKYLIHLLGLQTMLRSNVLYHSTLCQLVAASLHSTWSLHCLLHRSHGDDTLSEENKQTKALVLEYHHHGSYEEAMVMIL